MTYYTVVAYKPEEFYRGEFESPSDMRLISTDNQTEIIEFLSHIYAENLDDGKDFEGRYNFVYFVNGTHDLLDENYEYVYGDMIKKAQELSKIKYNHIVEERKRKSAEKALREQQAQEEKERKEFERLKEKFGNKG